MGEFTKYRIIAACFFLISLFLMIFFNSHPYSLLLLFISLCNLYGMICVFYLCCNVDNVPHRHFFERHMLLLCIYGVVTWYCKVELAIVLLPFLIGHVVLLAATIKMILWNWQFSSKIKGTVLLALIGLFLSQGVYVALVITNHSFEKIPFFVMACLLFLEISFSVLSEKVLILKNKIQKDYFYMMAENAVDIIFYYTFYPHSRFTFISPSVENVTGYKQKDFYRNENLHLEITHEEDRQIMKDAFSSHASAVNKNHVKWQRRDGEFIYLEFHNNPIYQGEELVAIEGIFRDVTERILAEKDMADAKKSRQLLLSYISHELKTPITYITGYAELLDQDMLLAEEEKRNAVKLILSKAVFLQNLVDDLFQLSKMESNQYSFEFVQMSVYELFSELNEMYEKDVFHASLQFTSTLSEELKDDKYEVLVDNKRMGQVYSNLIHNAMKHTPQGGTITSRCFLEERNKQVVFEISDSGEGIDKDDLPNIFKAFYKGKSRNRNQESNGLGLSLCQQIISAHRGKIEAVSKKNHGSTFRFSLPLYEEEA